MCTNIWGKGEKKAEPNSFPGAQEQDRRQWAQIKIQKMPYEHQETLSFIVRVTEHWPGLPSEVVKAPALKVFKRHLDPDLGNLLQVSLPEQGGWRR